MFIVSSLRSSLSSVSVTRRIFSSMSSILDQIPNVEIDPEGVFKYVLIRVYAPQQPDGTEPSKVIVRGNRRGNYHADIYDETVQKITSLKIDSECIGGGRINHSPSEKKLNIYGYSQGFGRADHQVTADILKDMYAGYDISWSDEGY